MLVIHTVRHNNRFTDSFLSLRDQSLTDIMPLYKTMKKATFSDSSDEVCLHIYVFQAAAWPQVTANILLLRATVADICNVIYNGARI